MNIDKNPQKIKIIFNRISNYYDKMNNVISFGSHYFIKIFVLKNLNIKPKSMVLDICCGTGDFTKIITKLQPKSNVIGLDFSEEMIKIAKNKNPKNVFMIGDVTDLPFKNGEFDFITSGFGLRNIENRKKALSEIYRVMKTNGKFLHLDFGTHNLISKIFDKYVIYITKFLRINKDDYQYLIQSKNDFPEPDILIEEFIESGFKFFDKKEYLFGAVSAQIMIK